MLATIALFLRERREAAGFIISEAAKLVDLSRAVLQRIETGSLNFRNVGDLRRLLAKYGVEDEEVIESLVELNRDAADQDWVTRYRAHLLPAMKSFVGIEAEAR